jgi:SAM-dependent methyltransferase
MRAVLARNVQSADVRAGSAEAIPLADASADAAFVGEAFHWFDSAAAVGELARVLRPGAPVLVCFNHWASLEPELPEEFVLVLREAQATLPEPGGPKAHSGLWQAGFTGAPFAPLEEATYAHEWVTTAESLVAFYVSISSMGALPPDERLALRARLLSLLADVPYRFDIEARVFRTVRQ